MGQPGGRPGGRPVGLSGRYCQVVALQRSHVFVLDGDGGRRFFALRAWRLSGRSDVAAAVRLMAQLSRGGPAVVRPVASVPGALTVTVPTQIGALHAIMVKAAPGEEADLADLTESRARRWGEALARLHRDASGLGAGLGESFGELPGIARLFADDTALVEAALTLAGGFATSAGPRR